jgi:hypothetical protein
MPTTVRPCPLPRIMPRSAEHRVLVDGVEVPVLATRILDGKDAGLALVEIDGPAEVEVRCARTPARATVRPLARGCRAEVAGDSVRFRLERPADLWIDIPGQGMLFLGAAPPLAEPTGDVLRFAGGQVHEVGDLRLRSGQQVWLEPGAVLRGRIQASGAAGVAIRGHGIIDGGYYRRPEYRRTILLEGCRDALIEGVAIVSPSSWTVNLGACDGVTVRGARILSDHCGCDGIDICGSSAVLVEDCLIATNDDCVVVKSIDPRRPGRDDETLDWTRDIAGIEVRGCALLNGPCGNALEIGHELRCARVAGVAFRDCDIMHVMGMGAAFSIHDGDHCLVEDVLFEDIRVEHHYDKLVDFRVMRSQYSRTPERGRIRKVVLRRCDIAVSTANPGYTTSQIGGWDEAHRIEGVIFEACTHGGRPLRDGQELDLFVRHADVSFR